MDSLELPMAPLAVGVSGGADSVCLALLLKKWCAAKRIPFVALTVNHHLRPESKMEAKQVAVQMKAHGIEHHILNWTGKKPTTRIEERARTARYDLLQDFCALHDISHLCLGHHSEDQAETFFLRLSKASGLDGLTAMAPCARRGDLTLVRPLLAFSKQDILDTLRALGESWVEDSMNHDMSFERVRWRSFLPELAQRGVSASTLTTTTRRLNRARTALDFYAQEFINAHVSIAPEGYAQIDSKALFGAPLEIQMRVLGRVLSLIGQSDKPLSMEALEKALERLPVQMTLGECHIIQHKNGLFIAKESARMDGAKKISARQWTRWDRFFVWCDEPATIKASAPLKRIATIPYLVQKSFPCVTQIKIPTLDYIQNFPYINTYIQFTPKNKG